MGHPSLIMQDPEPDYENHDTIWGVEQDVQCDDDWERLRVTYDTLEGAQAGLARLRYTDCGNFRLVRIETYTSEYILED